MLLLVLAISLHVVQTLEQNFDLFQQSNKFQAIIIEIFVLHSALRDEFPSLCAQTVGIILFEESISFEIVHNSIDSIAVFLNQGC